MIGYLERRRQIKRDTELQLAFKRLFKNELGIRPEAVPILAFIASFCFANQSALVHDKDGSVDMYATAAIAGRQEVWREIHKFLDLMDEKELIKLDRWLQDQQTRLQEPIDHAG